MGREIERKYLVVDDSYKAMARGVRHIRQGYLSRDVEATVRVRIVDNEAMLTIKSRNHGAERGEWEYAIPVVDAEEMLQLAQPPIIEKTRYLVDYLGHTWEVDCFEGQLAPLVIAEVELSDASVEPPLPPFVGEEVTGNPRYYNSQLTGC